MSSSGLGLGLRRSTTGGGSAAAPRRAAGEAAETPATAAALPRWSSSPEKTSRNKLNARVSHPVQGTVCDPFVHTRNGEGESLPDSALTFAWYRSTSFRHCAFAGCPRGAVELEAPPKLQCMGCLEAGLPEEFSYFCSSECFRAGAPAFAHAAFAMNADAGADAPGSSAGGAVATGGRPSPSPTDDKKEVLVGALQRFPAVPFRGGVKSAGLTPGPDTPPPTTSGPSPEWTLVSTARAYTPRVADVWHRLRLVITVRWSEGGPGATETRRIDTEWVCPAPPPHPPRSLTFRSCPAVGITAGTLASAQAAQAALMPPDKGSRVRLDGGRLPDQATHPPPPRLSPAVIRVVSYNTLAEIYATKTQYPYAPLWVLSWSYRRLLLVAELRRLDADILCLQEVQADHFDSFLCPALKSLGYTGLYKQKTRDSMGKAGRVDGCALFYKTSRFALQSKHVVEFNEAASMKFGGASSSTGGVSGGLSTPMKRGGHGSISSPAPDIAEPATGPAYAANSKQSILAGASGEGKRALQRLLRDNVAQVVSLQIIADAHGAPVSGRQGGSSPPELLVCNTHLFWDPEFGDVKLWQTHMLVRELESMCAANGTPLVLCGDFNSEPHTAVSKLLGRNAASGQTRSLLQVEDMPHDPVGVLPPREELCHGLMLASSYASVMGRDPEFTNFTEGYQGTLDYIWYTADSLVPVAALDIPSGKSLKEYSSKPLPNEQWPSDHLCLCTDFMLLPSGAGAGRPSLGAAAPPVRSTAPDASVPHARATSRPPMPLPTSGSMAEMMAAVSFPMVGTTGTTSQAGMPMPGLASTAGLAGHMAALGAGRSGGMVMQSGSAGGPMRNLSGPSLMQGSHMMPGGAGMPAMVRSTSAPHSGAMQATGMMQTPNWAHATAFLQQQQQQQGGGGDMAGQSWLAAQQRMGMPATSAGFTPPTSVGYGQTMGMGGSSGGGGFPRGMTR